MENTEIEQTDSLCALCFSVSLGDKQSESDTKMRRGIKLTIGSLVVFGVIVTTLLSLHFYLKSDGYKIRQILEWGELPPLPASSKIVHVKIDSTALFPSLFIADGVLQFKASKDEIRSWIGECKSITPAGDFNRIKQETGVLKYVLHPHVGHSDYGKLEVDEKAGTVDIKIHLGNGPA